MVIVPSDSEASIQIADHRLVVYGACKAAIAYRSSATKKPRHKTTTHTDREITLVIALRFRKPDFKVERVVLAIWDLSNDTTKRFSVTDCRILSSHRRDF